MNEKLLSERQVFEKEISLQAESVDYQKLKVRGLEQSLTEKAELARNLQALSDRHRADNQKLTEEIV